jgi:hypothetical protein
VFLLGPKTANYCSPATTSTEDSYFTASCTLFKNSSNFQQKTIYLAKFLRKILLVCKFWRPVRIRAQIRHFGAFAFMFAVIAQTVVLCSYLYSFNHYSE